MRSGSTPAQREQVMEHWRRALLHQAVTALVEKWEARIVCTDGYAMRAEFHRRARARFCSSVAGDNSPSLDATISPRALKNSVVG